MLTSADNEYNYPSMGKIRSLYIVSIITLSLGTGDTPVAPKGTFPIVPHVFHHPDDVVFNTRPYEIDLFVDLDDEEVASASLFLKTDQMAHFTEYPLTKTRARYRHRFNPVLTPANSIAYFFVVTMENGAVYAAPLNKHGNINVVERKLLDPAEYFKKRLAQRR